MRDYPAFRKAAVRYWERRRIFYNLALVLPSLFGYMLTAGVIYVGDPHRTLYSVVLFWFALSALGANVCYSFAYALEFLFGCDEPTSRWLRFERTSAFVAGVLFAMILALIGGRNIAEIEFHEQDRPPGNLDGNASGSANKAASGKGAIALLFHCERPGRALPEHHIQLVGQLGNH